MTRKFSIDNRELLQRISSGEAVVGIDFGNLIVRELAAFRLAAMDSEPNCKERKLFCSTDTARMRKVISASAGAEGTPLYRHAQQPVSEYPEVLPCPVLLDPGLRFGKGIKTSTMLAALARRAVYESDMAALSPEEIVEFQARIEDFKVLIAQPAPVVPEEATPDSIEILASARRRDHAVFQWNEDQRNAAADSWNACRAAMLAAAPQSPGGDHATVPGKWIPVSERMPEDEQEVLTINKMGHRFVSFFDKHSGLFFDRLDAPAACCIEHVLVTHWMPLPAAPQEVKGE
ncbi:DUF551 domain-containing protein [Klebsiella pneumoniae]|uniref:DUF551 domain-containing protein n=1 Tax=Klebsiella pneumoniae TaxID=573 RepID=UPI001145009C|nr:DUF551 domain-containing protein [Klebsiella pneumoniae]TYX60229.1 DUF551 domain-containing protein [Klebsiella pneumoniae]TYX70207.1 DUF551 domain-containing protein [Klebsiella pneumoniae]TYY14291.1 DUF551 domain-containing protein [Klebsiella pneumoniae]TYY70061.1 DUF551 domain-containing protein [Klebsiella pneumoniae]